MGKEGRQAVRCSDFAFGKFKCLRDALLVHGNWYYLRVATLVQYFFYKNIVFILPQFYFLFFNGYSTQPIYDSMYLTTFNLFFTSLPIVFYGLLEQNYSAERLLSEPSLYTVHARNSLMTWGTFFKWFILGLWHSLVIYFLPLMSQWSNSSVMPYAQNSYLELFGVQICHSAVVVVNLKLWLHSRYWCLPFIGSIVFSLAIWFILASIYSLIYLASTSATYYTYIHFLESPNMWLMSLLIATVSLIPDLVVDTFSNMEHSIPRPSALSIISIVKKKSSITYGFNSRL